MPSAMCEYIDDCSGKSAMADRILIIGAGSFFGQVCIAALNAMHCRKACECSMCVTAPVSGSMSSLG